MKYTYGTSDLAAERLRDISQFFNVHASRLIGEFCTDEVATAIDLGCGPGYTTDMLAGATRCTNTYGLDTSDHFLSMARECFPRYEFLKHDVTQVPFPISAQVIYARFILAHLPDAESMVNKWADELADGGMLFLEEAEATETDVGVFKEYLDINEGLVASQGAELFVGKKLAGIHVSHRLVLNDSVFLPVPNWQAAAWFYPNTITIWEEATYIKERLSKQRRAEISQQIREIRDRKEDKSNITWRMRRVVIKKEE